jgi:hypothetical protein
MKNTLAENMLRFGVKNLSESDVKKLAEQGDMTNVNTAQKGASTPSEIKLKVYTMPRVLRVGGSNSADNLWSLDVILKGTPGKLTVASLVFMPDAVRRTKRINDPITINLQTPCIINVPIPFNVQPTTVVPIKLKYDANLEKLLLSSDVISTPQEAQYHMKSPQQLVDAGISEGIYIALANLAAEKGWYTGPNKPVASQYALFTNHTGDEIF